MLAPYRGCVKRNEHGGAERRDPLVGRAHGPVLVADITALIDAAGGANSSSHEQVAHATATAVVSAGVAQPSDSAQLLITLADVVGLDTLAALWSDAEPVSLPRRPVVVVPVTGVVPKPT